MAEDQKTVDLTRPVAELATNDADVASVLAEMGFDTSSERTLPELAEEAGVDLSIVGMALGASGYEVQGYVPTEDAKNSPLESLINELAQAEPLEVGAGSMDPMVLNMEYAIRRAQKNGELPADGADA